MKITKTVHGEPFSIDVYSKGDSSMSMTGNTHLLYFREEVNFVNKLDWKYSNTTLNRLDLGVCVCSMRAAWWVMAGNRQYFGGSIS